ncbi:MAG: cob(I)yrinic acid a,c-diamide adenosyltransferase [Chlorobi bacterium]|nr:cob(I)yrinic acid a,c-diamide adenosyltransferase [Chlorobiota bacterium]MCI0715660.1 cob(I)yrinic acid a,c-diamide adenosyltransferase [Chlorobiota bacterium]
MTLKKKKISLKEAREAGGKKYKEKIKKIIEDYKKLPDEKKHQIHLYYGYGKGKTTAAIGLAIRALGAGKKIAIVEFDKGYDEQTEHYSEHITLRKLKKQNLPLEVYRTGCERMNKDGTFRFKNADEDFKEAQRALSITKKLIRGGKQDLLILDEIIAAVVYHLIEKEDVFKIIDLYNKKRRFELVMTGHKLIEGLEEKVDLITEMRKIKHYFDKGIQARQGIEY